jgi:hypothetical protein
VQETTFWEALNRYDNRIHAVAHASPYSAAMLPDASQFSYRNGFLVYVMENEIRIRDVYRNADSEDVVTLDTALSQIMPSDRYDLKGIVLLDYVADTLVFQVKIEGGSRLIVLDPRQKKVRLKIHLPEVEGLFVRQNKRHLFVVTVQSTRDDAQWEIREFDLLQGSQMGSLTVLDDFADTRRIPHDVCFEMFGDNLHGVSNYMPETGSESDSSFYRWICLAPNSSSDRMTAKKIFREYHALHEGVTIPTQLSLQVCEKTGRPMVLECRYQRRKLGRSCRTYYGEFLPEDFDAYAQIVDLPLLGPTREDLEVYRRDKLVHPECLCQSRTEPDFSPSNAPCSFYNLSARTFLDLVSDPVPHNRVATPGQRFRLRFHSQLRTGSDRKHVSTQLWPSENDVAWIYSFGTSLEDSVVHAQADERALIYSVSDGSTKAIVLISFDPQIRFLEVPHADGGLFGPRHWVHIESAARFEWAWNKKQIENKP